jgi:SAM-dependent methyltransferase
MAVLDPIDYSRYADLYDAYVRVDMDIPFFLQQVQQSGNDVLELMAGTGRVSLPLLRAGVRLACVDASPEMLRRLQEKVQAEGLAAEIYEMDVRRLDLPRRYPLVIIPFHAFSELVELNDQRLALESIRRCLAPGGRLILTLHNPVARLKRVDGQLRLWAETPLDHGQLLVWGLETHDPADPIVYGSQFFELYDARGLLLSKRMVPFRFRVMTRAELEALAAACGLYPSAMWGGYDGSPYDEKNSSFMIWDFRADD